MSPLASTHGAPVTHFFGRANTTQRWSRWRSSWLLWLALALEAALMLPFLDIVPGLLGDEAWVGLRARAIADGQLSPYGMTAYTGPFHQFLVLPMLLLFGYRVWVLRLFTVLTSMLSTW